MLRTTLQPYLVNPLYLPFNSDWNYLMLAVEKIESLEDIEIVEVTNYRCLIRAYKDIDNKFKADYWYNEKTPLFNSKIEAVYNAVIEFIKWYNLNK